MRTVFLIVILSFSFELQAQLYIQPIKKDSGKKQDATQNQAVADPISLPFWDDFSITTDAPDSLRIWGSDTSRQWNYELSKDVFVNATLAINPPSYRVATFDGLDTNGAFHGEEVGLTDQLVSDTIDLQGGFDVVFSFYWQAGGNVEIPEEGASLVLQFYNQADTLSPWQTYWKKDGGELAADEDTVFTQVAIPIPSELLNQKFLFRFQSYGDQDGPFDAWHVDWIYMNNKRAEDDFFYEGEVSLNSDIKLLFSPFKSVPINQISDAAFITDVNVSSMNLNPEPDNIGLAVNYLLSIDEVGIENQITSGTTFTEDLRNFFNPAPDKVTMQNELTFSGLSFQDLVGTDSVIIEATVNTESTTTVDFLDGTNINLRVNDTVRTSYTLHNYYAYDDGTAEYAAGTNINGAQVTLQYWLQRPDTLTHVDIYFPNIDPSSTGSALELQIYKELSEDSDPIRAQSITVQNGTKLNAFRRYPLNNPLVLADTFYVGYRQNQNEYIGVGFDRSNEAASAYIYENKSGVWERNTRITGALMIRPVFEKLDSLVLGAAELPEEIKAYPNPTEGYLKIKGKYEAVTLMDFAGKVWYQNSKLEQHDLRNLPSGLYLLTVHRKEGDQTLKIIKE